MDKANILQKFRSQWNLTIEGVVLLIFADYSAELTKQRKMFSKICTQLFHKNIKFTLAYPATLHLQTPEGTQRTFEDPTEAEINVEELGALADKSPQDQVADQQ